VYLEKIQLVGCNDNYELAKSIIDQYFSNRETFLELEEVSESMPVTNNNNRAF